jgi:hypothetical protein
VLLEGAVRGADVGGSSECSLWGRMRWFWSLGLRRGCGDTSKLSYRLSSGCRGKLYGRLHSGLFSGILSGPGDAYENKEGSGGVRLG